jgi:hypothetical protein
VSEKLVRRSDSIVYDFNRGEDAASIQQNFDTLSLAEVNTDAARFTGSSL